MRNVARLMGIVALLCMGLSACDNSDLPPATQFSSFSGTVNDATTQKPISGASVVVDSVLTATTDDNGAFHIDRIPSGIVDYVVTASGYSTVNATANVDAGKPLTLTVSMGPPAP